MSSYSLAYGLRPSTLVEFLLSGDGLRPDAITQALRIVPFRGWAKEDPIVRNGETRPNTRPIGAWGLVPTAVSPDEDFAVQLGSLLDQREALPPVLPDLIATFDGVIGVAYSSGEWNFGFHIDSLQMKRVCGLGVALDFDLYPVAGSDDPDDDVGAEPEQEL